LCGPLTIPRGNRDPTRARIRWGNPSRLHPGVGHPHSGCFARLWWWIWPKVTPALGSMGATCLIRPNGQMPCRFITKKLGRKWTFPSWRRLRRIGPPQVGLLRIPPHRQALSRSSRLACAHQNSCAVGNRCDRTLTCRGALARERESLGAVRTPRERQKGAPP
jgi:hypothetical protein